PLNDTGRAEAARTAELLSGTQPHACLSPWTRTFSSPLSRAIETAQILSAALQLSEPQIEHTLYERDFGPAEGLLVDEAHTRWPGLDIPGAESLTELAGRTAATFDRLLHDSPGSIVVAHGAMIRAGLTHLTGSEIPRIINGEVWILTSDANRFRTHRLDTQPSSAQPPAPTAAQR
ncbi:MAG: histidine phosphatase family protein, partial [Leucobacter sp.]|nr:histidine phosphatase family protein [Leucobacter sp.]